MARDVNFTLIFLGSAIIMSLVSFILISIGNLLSLSYITLVTGPLAALVVGISGFKVNARGGGVIGNDQFSAMNSFFALGTIVMVVSETITSAVWLLPDRDSYYFIIIILQFPGLLLWALGTTSYFHACIEALGCYDVKKAMVTVMTVSVVIVLVLTHLRQTHLVAVLSGFPTLIALTIAALTLGWLLWTFKGGRLRRPLGLFFLAVLIFLFQTVAWSVFNLLPIDCVARVFTVESYLVLGLALTLPQNL